MKYIVTGLKKYSMLSLQLLDPRCVLDDSRGENDPGATGGGDGKVLPRDEEVLVLLGEIVDFGLCCGCLHVWLLALVGDI
jgi:hypothetical protein